MVTTTVCQERGFDGITAVYIGDDLAIAAGEPGVTIGLELLESLGVRLSEALLIIVDPFRVTYLGEYPDRLRDLLD